MRQSEHVLYITLVDFLLQLLFLGMVVSVIYTAAQPDPEEAQLNKSIVEQIKKTTGISDLTVLTDLLTRLGPLNQVQTKADLGRDLEDAVKKVGGKDEALNLLNAAAKKGQGLPPCLAKGEKLATFHAYAERIEIQSPVTSEMSGLLKGLGLTLDSVAKLSLTDFLRVFSPVIARNQKEQCIYNVVLIEHVYDTRPRDVIRKTFSPQTFPASDIK
jgi:hypothetical protein